VFAIVAMGVFLAALDLFIVNIAFPAIQRDFSGSSVSDVSWVLNVYAIVFAALLVSAGKLGDILGRRRVFVAGLLAFGLGSALSAAAPSLELLIAARVIQGAGAAAVTPTSLGLLLPAFGTPSGAAAATDTCSRVSPRHLLDEPARTRSARKAGRGACFPCVSRSRRRNGSRCCSGRAPTVLLGPQLAPASMGKRLRP
jgi:hypothetical protein